MEDVTNAQHLIKEEVLEESIDLDEMGDKTMAAMGVLKTIGTLILSLESTPDVRKFINNSVIVVSYVFVTTLAELGLHV